MRDRHTSVLNILTIPWNCGILLVYLYNLIKLNQLNKRKMKKVIAIFAIATTMVACGGKGTTEATTDSTEVVVDSVVVNADTTAVAPAAPVTVQ